MTSTLRERSSSPSGTQLGSGSSPSGTSIGGVLDSAGLMPVVYEELHALAERFLRRERPGHTLQPTALVHEAYLRLARQDGVAWRSSAQFYRVAAEAMRRVLVNHARDRGRLKRGGGAQRLALEDVELFAPERGIDILALNEALFRLGRVDRRKVELVQLRFFCGFSLEEVSEVLGVSVSQLKRDWSLARAWLWRELSGDGA